MLTDAWSSMGSSCVSGEHWWYWSHSRSLSWWRTVLDNDSSWTTLSDHQRYLHWLWHQRMMVMGWKRAYMGDDLLDCFCGCQTDGMYCFLHWTRCFLQRWWAAPSPTRVVFTPPCLIGGGGGVGTLEICQWSTQDGWQSMLRVHTHWFGQKSTGFFHEFVDCLFLDIPLIGLDSQLRYQAWMQLTKKFFL